MTKKLFVVILILSIVATYVTTFIDALVNKTLLGGEAGFPFKYSSSTLFGEGETNYLLMVLNIVFWFLVIWGVWKLIHKSRKK